MYVALLDSIHDIEEAFGFLNYLALVIPAHRLIDIKISMPYSLNFDT